LAKQPPTVDLLISFQVTLDRLPQQVCQTQQDVVPPRVGQVLLDVSPESQTLIRIPHQNQADV
jgi:hypothetical protein